MNKGKVSAATGKLMHQDILNKSENATLQKFMFCKKVLDYRDGGGGGVHDEPRFSFLKFNRLVDSLQNFEYEYTYKKRR